MWNFVERHSFRIVSGDSRKLCLFTKFPHHEIRWNYGISRSLSLHLTAYQYLSTVVIQPFSCTEMLDMLTSVLTKSKQDQFFIFRYTYCKSFWVHLPVIVYHFAHIDHDIRLEFLFHNLPKLFLYVCIQHPLCLFNYRLL